MCQGYVKQLGQLSPEVLEMAGASVVVMFVKGKYINVFFIEFLDQTEANLVNSSFPGTVYADPSRELFKALGMTIESLKRTPEGEKPKSYVGGLIAVSLRSIIGIRNPMHIGKQGNFSQLGGEFVIGPGRTCTFAHRMLHTQDRSVQCYCGWIGN